VQQLVRSISVLVIDDSPFARRLIRSLLQNVGVKAIYEAGDGVAGIEAIRVNNPDVVLLDWEMPLLDGPEFMRIVRSPETFPAADVPIIMLTAYAERWRVMEALRLGVNEFMRKPISAQALLDRLIAVLGQRREIVRLKGYYGPLPRKLPVDRWKAEPTPHPRTVDIIDA
jgi:CheY-like chemotaxis protein